MAEQKTQSAKENDEINVRHSTGQKSQLPTRVRQLTSQLSAADTASAPSTLPRAGRERQRLSQRRAVTGSMFLLQDAGRGKPLRRPASAADVDREVKKERRDVSAPPTSAVSTPTLASASASAAASRPRSAMRSSSRTESLPRRQSRVSIMTEEEKRKREMGWNSPQNRSKSLPRLPRNTATTRRSSAPVVERLTRPPPLRKARSFAATQPPIEETEEGTKAGRRSSAGFASSGGKPDNLGSKVQSSTSKTSPSGTSVRSKSTESQPRAVLNAAAKASIGSRTSMSRFTSPDARVKSPDSRITSPDSRVTSPCSRVTSPDSRVTSPISRNTSPGSRSLPASYRKRSRCSPVSEPDTTGGCCRRTSHPKLSDPSQFRPPSSLAKLSVTAKTPPTSFSRAAIPKEAGTARTEGQKQRQESITGSRKSTEQEDMELGHPTYHNGSPGRQAQKEDITTTEEFVAKLHANEMTAKRVEFTSSDVTIERIEETAEEEATNAADKSKLASSTTMKKELPLTTDLKAPCSNLPSPDSHNLSHTTSASEETGYVSSASHSPPSRSASGSRVSGLTSSGLVLRYESGSKSVVDQLSMDIDSKEEQSESVRVRVSEANPFSAAEQALSTEDKGTRKRESPNVTDATEKCEHANSNTSDVKRRGRTPQRSYGPPRTSVSSATLDRFRRSSITPDRFGGSLDRRCSGSSPSDAAELAYLRGTLLSPGAGLREESLDRYLAAVARLLRLSRRSAGFQQLKPHCQALQRATEKGAPADQLHQMADEHVRALLEQLEQQQQKQLELQVSSDRGRTSGRWSGDVGLRFRGRSVEDLKRMFAGQSRPESRSQSLNQSRSQSRRESTTSSLTQSQVSHLRQQLQQLHSGESPRRDVISPTSSRSGFSVDVTDLNGLNDVLPVRPPPPQPPVRSHTSYSLTSRSTTLPSVVSSASPHPPAPEERLQLIERSERLRRLREERIGRPVSSGAPPTSSIASATATSSQTSTRHGAGLSPHQPNPVQKPPRARDIPDDGFRSLPSSSRLRRQRAMTSVQYEPQRTVSEQLAAAAEGGDVAEEDDGMKGPTGAVVRPVSAETRREARETAHRSSAPPSLSWDVSETRRRPLPTPRASDEGSEVQLECNHRPEPEPQRRRRTSVRKMLLSGFSSLRRKFRSRSDSRKRKMDSRVVVKLSDNTDVERGDGSGNSQPSAVETQVKKVDAATSTAVETNVKRTVGSPHRVRTVGHISTSSTAANGHSVRPDQSKPRRPTPEVSLIGQMFTSSPELGDVDSYSRVWRHTTSGMRDEFRPVSNFSARTDGSVAESSVVASTPVPPSESSDFSAVWRGPAEMDWSIHRPIGRYVPGTGGGNGSRSLPRPRARRHPPPPVSGSLPRPVPRKTPCPCCVRPGDGEHRPRQETGGENNRDGGE